MGVKNLTNMETKHPKISVFAFIEDGHNRTLLVEDSDIEFIDNIPALERSIGKEYGWKPAGGKVKENESLLATLLREVHEETGFIVQPLNLIWIRDFIREKNGRERIQFFFRARRISGELNIPNKEIKSYYWFTRSDLLSLNKEMMKKEHYFIALQEYLQGKTLPFNPKDWE